MIYENTKKYFYNTYHNSNIALWNNDYLFVGKHSKL